MEKFRAFGSLFLAMLSCFNIGLYASSTFRFGETIELYRWILTSLFGLAFLVNFLIEYKKTK